MKYINKKGEIVELTSNKTINKYGDVLLWVKCENGNTISVLEDQFKIEFIKL